MTRFVLDTDTVTLFRAGNAVLAKRVQDCPREDIAVTVITVEEQLTGWYTLLRQKHSPAQLSAVYERLAGTVRFFTEIPILGFSEKAIDRYLELQASKLNVGKPDLRIAAIALEIGAAVVTRNARDFGRVPGLAHVDWTAGD